VISRAKTVIGKRHQMIHEAWGLSEIGFEVSRQTLPAKSPFENGYPCAF
jgi:hypothetical protein